MGRNEPTPNTALALFKAITPPIVVYGTEDSKGVHDILRQIADEVHSAVIDVTTKAGREAANSLAYKIARSKTLLDDMGKDLVADWKAKAKLVDDERKTIRDRLDALKAEVKQPVDDWEKAEADRIAGHLNAITEIEDLVRFDGEPSSAAVAQRLAVLTTITSEDRDWQEFADQATSATKAVADKLAAIFEGAVKREADARELEALRAEKAERDRKDREAEEARAAEQRVIEAAAQIAEQRAIEAAAQKQRDEQAAKERERIAAEQAVEAERQRVADEAAAKAAADAKRERNKKHRAKITGEAVAAVSGILTKQRTLAGWPVDLEVGDRFAHAIVDEIAAGQIPHIKIEF